MEQHRQEPFSALLAALEASHSQFISYLEALPAKNLINGKARRETSPTLTIQNLLRVEVRDEQAHAGQIRAFFLEAGI